MDIPVEGLWLVLVFETFELDSDGHVGSWVCLVEADLASDPASLEVGNQTHPRPRTWVVVCEKRVVVLLCALEYIIVFFGMASFLLHR